jgi:hypothetical protein
MTRKFLCCAFLAAFAWFTISAGAYSATQQSQQQQQDQAKSVSGKVTDIGSDRKSFSLEAKDDKRTIQFVVDENTQVQGHVTVGTVVTVQYQAMNDGKNLAMNITPQGS